MPVFCIKPIRIKINSEDWSG